MSVFPTAEQMEARAAEVTKSFWATYDVMVLGLSCRFLWKCPSHNILGLYNRLVSANHLDVGVGTGFFLDRCRFPSHKPRLALMDLNTNALEVAAARIARYRPEVYQSNVLEPIQSPVRSYDSVSLSLVLHCLPGTIQTKTVVFDNLKALMTPGAVLFGATVLWGGVHRSWLATRVLDAYNNKGIFSNRHDDLDGLREALADHFSDTEVEVFGCVALFSGRKPPAA